MKLLGITITNDLKWKTNTENMVKKCFGRLWMIQRLKVEGASINDHKDVLIKKIRSVLEFA